MAETQTNPDRSRRRRKPSQDAAGLASDLNYREARTALDLSLAELQASDLDVEAMAGLYQRAEAYAQRCELLLNQVEQEVSQWNSSDPSAAPIPFTP